MRHFNRSLLIGIACLLLAVSGCMRPDPGGYAPEQLQQPQQTEQPGIPDRMPLAEEAPPAPLHPLEEEKEATGTEEAPEPHIAEPASPLVPGPANPDQVRAPERKGSRLTGPRQPPRKPAKSAGRELTLPELRQKYPSQFVFHGSTHELQAALSFDDAPDETYTAQVLDILRKYKVRATFFIVGYRAEKHPELVRRMIDEGHAVGNHSYAHHNLSKLEREPFLADLDKTERIIQNLAGYSPRLLRPPYGAIKERHLLWATEQNYIVVNWNVDSEDWRGIGAEQIIANVMKDVDRGSIILQHSGTGHGGDLRGTVEALPQLIEKLQAGGYQLVTIPELLHVQVSK